MAESPHVAAADAAWAAAKRRFLVPETELLADFLGADGFAGLPTPDEVRRAFPDRHGYGTGQEDGMIHAGAMLDVLAAILRHADPDRCSGCGPSHLIEALSPGVASGREVH